MTRFFFPGCKIKAKYPQVSEWLEQKVLERGYADTVAGCCRTDHQSLEAGDAAVCMCNNCMAMIEEDAEGALESIWVLIDADPGFPLPNYEGKVLGIQDCGRAYDRVDVQDAVRNILRKMEVEVAELPDAREKSSFCEFSVLSAVPEQDASFAPKRYVEDAPARGMFVACDPSEHEARMREHAVSIPVDEVACYCTACDAGLAMGGKDPVNLIELISGCFIER